MLVESQAKTRSLMKMRKVVQKKVGNLRSEKQPDLKIEDTENFLEGILRVLLHARRLLATSYGIGFLIPDERKEVKNAHETIQVWNICLNKLTEGKGSNVLVYIGHTHTESDIYKVLVTAFFYSQFLN